MKKILITPRIPIIIFSIIMMLTINALALTPDDMKMQGTLLADLLVTGRGVVAKSLAKFKVNDPAIGDKGFTPDYFEQEINAQYKQKSGIDIMARTSTNPLPGNTMDLLKKMLQASKQVCQENQALINMQGIGFKGFIPASYGRMVADIFKEETGIVIKQTTPRYRNTYNKPDDFEKNKLAQMEASSYPKGQMITEMAGQNYRVMKPIYIKKSCLVCHGDPKGSKDVAGRTKEGYKEGDLRGAISIAIPVN